MNRSGYGWAVLFFVCLFILCDSPGHSSVRVRQHTRRLPDGRQIVVRQHDRRQEPAQPLVFDPTANLRQDLLALQRQRDERDLAAELERQGHTIVAARIATFTGDTDKVVAEGSFDNSQQRHQVEVWRWRYSWLWLNEPADRDTAAAGAAVRMRPESPEEKAERDSAMQVLY